MLKYLLTGLVFVGLLPALPLLADDSEPVITVAYANQWQPYSYSDQEGGARGILVDVVDYILHQKLGLDIKHLPLPWERAQNMVRNGSYDALITAPTAERQFYFNRTDSALYRLQWKAYLSNKSSNFKRLNEAENPLAVRNISCVSLLGDRTSESLYRRFNQSCRSVKSLPIALNMMQAGRVDLFIHSKTIMDQQLSSWDTQGRIVEHPTVLKKVPFVLMVSKYSPYAETLPEQVDQLVNKLAVTGEYDRFLSKLNQGEYAASN